MITRMFKNSKGQAAFEFLTTYGWAFLVILIMVGTLAYFGILNPSEVLPNRCTMGAEFQCLDYQVSATQNTFRLRLKNGAGESITLLSATSIDLSSESTTDYSCTLSQMDGAALPIFPYTWAPGAIHDFLWNNCNSAPAGMVAGNKGKVLIKLNYYTTASGPNYAKDIKGQVFTSVG